MYIRQRKYVIVRWTPVDIISLFSILIYSLGIHSKQNLLCFCTWCEKCID